jgi:DNA-binding PucR family transcriptional regulator
MITRTSSIEEIKRVEHLFGDQLLEKLIKSIEKDGFVTLRLEGSVISIAENGGNYETSSFKEFVKEVSRSKKSITKKLTIQKDEILEDALDLLSLKSEKEKVLLKLLPIQEQIDKIVEKHKDLSITLSTDELLGFRHFDGEPVEYYLFCIAKRKQDGKD